MPRVMCLWYTFRSFFRHDEVRGKGQNLIWVYPLKRILRGEGLSKFLMGLSIDHWLQADRRIFARRSCEYEQTNREESMSNQIEWTEFGYFLNKIQILNR